MCVDAGSDIPTDVPVEDVPVEDATTSVSAEAPVDFSASDIPYQDYATSADFGAQDFVTPEAPYQDYASAVDFETPVSSDVSGVQPFMSDVSFQTPEAPYQDYQTAPDFSAAQGQQTNIPEIAGKAGDYLKGALKSIGAMDEKGGLGKNAIPLLGIVQAAYANRQAGKQAASLKNQLMQSASQTRGVADQLLSQYQAGEINAATKSQIDQATAAAIAQIKQRYAQMGRNPDTDSAAQNEIATAQQRALQLTEQARQGILAQGLQAAGISQGPTSRAILAEYQADRQNAQDMYQLLAALSRLQNRESANEQGK